MNKVSQIIMNATPGIAFAMIAYIFVSLVYPFNPATINKVEIHGDRFKRGESVDVFVDLCKNMDSPATITYELVNEGNSYTTLTTYHTGGGGGQCQQFVDESTIIPETVRPGIYKLHIIVSYQINSFRDVQYFFLTSEFEII